MGNLEFADMHVLSGNDLDLDVYKFLSFKTETNVKFRWIDKSDIEAFDKMLLPSVQPVTRLVLVTRRDPVQRPKLFLYISQLEVDRYIP